MSTRTTALLAVFVSMVGSGAAFGQSSVVEPGAHVRIRVERTWSEHSVVGVGRGSRGKGLLVGGTIGGVAGAVAGLLMRQDCPSANDLGTAIVEAYCSAANEGAPLWLGGLGLLVGGGIGALAAGGERWRTIAIAPVAVASSPHGRVGIALRVGGSFSVR